MVLQGVTSIYAAHMSDVGIEQSFISIVATISSVALSFSKFLNGFMYDKIGLRVTITIDCISAIGVMCVLFFLTNSPLGFVLAIVYALLAAVALPLETVMLPIYASDLFGDKSFNKILYKTNSEDMILSVDLMHLYKFYEPIFQCKFSSCLGKNIFISRKGTVHFCPMHVENSFMGSIYSQNNYFDTQIFKNVLHSAIEKRSNCKSTCKYYDHCSGGCPLECGCCNFPELFEKKKSEFDRITQNNEPLTDKKLAVAKIVVKDIAYGE
jgi:radical SAM protein with 4Fe4S-binding SPASM domain